MFFEKLWFIDVLKNSVIDTQSKRFIFAIVSFAFTLFVSQIVHRIKLLFSIQQAGIRCSNNDFLFFLREILSMPTI